MTERHCVSECANTILSPRAVAAARREMLAAGCAAVQPATVFAALFGEQLDPYMVRRIETRYHRVMLRRARGAPSRPGFIYVFRDQRDPDGLVKIGRTTEPARRLEQWRVELGAGGGNTLVNLVTCPTRDPGLAEAVLHTLLWSQQCTGRVNRRTGRRLTEYFVVHDTEALAALCQAVARHVDAAMQAVADLK